VGRIAPGTPKSGQIVNARWILKACGVIGAALVLTLVSGCRDRLIKEGTQGVLRFNDEPVANIRLTVNRVEPKGIKPVGSAVTAADGTFQLVTHGGRAGLMLTPGDYRCTLKSMGASVHIPNHYAEVNTTPLKVSWSNSDTTLNLEVHATAAQSPPR
jgi:hypothetical protein